MLANCKLLETSVCETNNQQAKRQVYSRSRYNCTMIEPQPPASNLTRAYIGLGSNSGSRIGFVQQAMQLLKDIPGLTVKQCSSLYESEPTNRKYKEWFVNAVAAIDTTLSAEELLANCTDIESRLTSLNFEDTKRCPSSGQTSPKRIIDLDILFFGSLVQSSEFLQLPHPHVTKRAYALVPLLEIAPELTHPVSGQTMLDLHDSLSEPEMVCLYGTREFIDELV